MKYIVKFFTHVLIDVLNWHPPNGDIIKSSGHKLVPANILVNGASRVWIGSGDTSVNYAMPSWGNSLSPVWHQIIIWNNTESLSIARGSASSFIKMWIKIQSFRHENTIEWQPSILGRNVLNGKVIYIYSNLYKHIKVWFWSCFNIDICMGSIAVF